MSAPSVICQRAGGLIAPGNPCQLSPEEANTGLGDWEYLINHRPSGRVKAELAQRFHGGTKSTSQLYHRVEFAYGDLSLDFYPVAITSMPLVEGRPLTPEELVLMLRLHLNLFVDPDKSFFEAYDEALDAGRWASSAPEGAVIHIELLYDPGEVRDIFATLVDLNSLLNLDDGSVVVSENGPRHWIFSTLWTPDDGDHPVSGNRQFGCAVMPAHTTLPSTYGNIRFPEDQDTLYVYTRGADRCTRLSDWTAEGVKGIVFGSAHELWVALQERVRRWVFDHGGDAYVPGYVAARHDWDDAIVKPGLWKAPSP